MGDSIFSGLDSFGLGGLEDIDIFGSDKKADGNGAASQAAQAPQLTEKDYLLDKKTKCPLCDMDFAAKTVKTGKVKLVSQDMDLRSKYQELDPLKYDVIMCPFCGYTALAKYFPTILPTQAKKIKETISAKFKPKFEDKEIYTYDDALERYKMALVNAVVKGAKASEKAYICLKASWVARGKAEEIGESHADYAKVKATEAEFTRNAYEGFSQAVSQESFPMCGMDEMTINYLIGVLAMYTGHYDVAGKMVAVILTSNSANSRMKERARTLKDEVVKKLKAKA